jgi:hypothetical protein
MKTERCKTAHLEQYLGCFGSMSMEDVVCRRHCALNVRCAIEKEQNTRLAVLEDFEIGDDILLRSQ